MSRREGSLLKFIAGIGIGVGAGMLLAPKSGEELRKDLMKKINELLDKAKEIDVNEVADDFKKKATDLKKIYVKNMRGEMVPLMTMISLEQTVGAASITRFNQYRSVQFAGLPSAGKSSGEAMKAMEEIAVKTLPGDMGYDWSGTSLQERESTGQTGTVIALALVFVYLFLVALYESWMIPVAVLLISPVAIVGALIFQLMMGQALDL